MKNIGCITPISLHQNIFDENVIVQSAELKKDDGSNICLIDVISREGMI